MEFQRFSKMARLSREMVITEKIDGTNAQVCITEDGKVLTGSRNRWVTPENDNFGFALWVKDNEKDLLNLGPGRHYGEWWGQGIQRGYGVKGRYFSLFDALRWENNWLPTCVSVVPILYRGLFDTNIIEDVLDYLKVEGSVVSKGFLNPEGVIVHHIASGTKYKKTLVDDDKPKGKGD